LLFRCCQLAALGGRMSSSAAGQLVLVNLKGTAGLQVQPELIHGPANQDRRSMVSVL